jgi:hypothetical protein
VVAFQTPDLRAVAVEKVGLCSFALTRWRDGDMRRRWCVAGLLLAECKFRRLKGLRGMPTLLEALEEMARGEAAGTEREVA